MLSVISRTALIAWNTDCPLIVIERDLAVIQEREQGFEVCSSKGGHRGEVVQCSKQVRKAGQLPTFIMFSGAFSLLPGKVYYSRSNENLANWDVRQGQWVDLRRSDDSLPGRGHRRR